MNLPSNHLEQIAFDGELDDFLSTNLTHFYQARTLLPEPDDQHSISHPRIGFSGVIDERLNLHLLDKMAELRPEFQFILIGPVVRIDPSLLPVRENIHYLGKKNYYKLPQYVSGWDCAFLPFSFHEYDQVPNPTNIPEYLAAGKPVVSTSVPEMVHPYADAKLIYIADHPEHFVESIERAVNESSYDPEWLERVDQYLESYKAPKPHIPAYMDSALKDIGIV